jgi:tetratricopeptide (TPR) repeat protein
LSRLLDFYLATATRVYAMERPGDRTIVHLEKSACEGQTFSAAAQALDWLHAEAEPLLACVQQSLTAATLRRAIDLLLATIDLAESGAGSRRYEIIAVAASRAAAEQGDGYAEARARITLAQVLSQAGRFDEAEREAKRADILNASANDPWATSTVPNQLGIIAICTARYSDAEGYFLRAIDAFQADENKPGEASAVCNLSRTLASMGRSSEAVELAQRGVEIYDELGLSVRLANARYASGIVLTQAGRLQEAQTQLGEALRIFTESRQRLWEGTTHFRIAQVHLAARRFAQAAQHAEQSLAIGCIGGDWMKANALTVLGKALEALGQSGRAGACWREALAIYEAAGSSEAAEVRSLLVPLAAA